MSEDLILHEVIGRVGVVRINRPKALNALNPALMQELMQTLQTLDANPEIGAMVLTGDARAFAAGADIKAMAQKSAVDMLKEDLIGLWDRIRQIQKPIVAAVSGWCLGGGCELALSCDMIVASDSVKFGQPEINIGVIPGAGGTQRLTRAVGKAIAMEMVLNNRTLSAAEALQYGLINSVFSVEEYFSQAVALAEEIANRAPIAVRLGKECVNQALETSLSEGLFLERRNFYYLFSSSDQKEGMEAFIEKRDPTWKGV